MQYPELTVSAVIFNQENKVLLCRSHKWENKYVIPGGHVEYGEKLEDALRREVLEETGLRVYNIQLLGVKECFYSNNHYKNRHFIFMDYKCRTDSSQVVLNDEAQEYRWVSLEDIHEIELGGFIGSLLNKLLGDESDSASIPIFYNYK